MWQRWTLQYGCYCHTLICRVSNYCLSLYSHIAGDYDRVLENTLGFWKIPGIYFNQDSGNRDFYSLLGIRLSVDCWLCESTALFSMSSIYIFHVVCHCVVQCSISGVPVAYRSVRLVENYGYLMDDQPYIHVDVNVEYIVFCPRVGSTVRAVVNQKGSDHMSGLVLGLFNIAVTLRSKHGNEMKSQINIGQELLLKVTNIYVCNGILSMRGRLRHRRVNSLWCLKLGHILQIVHVIYLRWTYTKYCVTSYEWMNLYSTLKSLQMLPRLAEN